MTDLKSNLKTILKPAYHKVQDSFLAVPLYYVQDASFVLRHRLLGKPDISPEDRKNVEQNVTFIYKSFNRQVQAERLYHNIRCFYPDVRIIIADDSREPLRIEGAEIVYLPFNSGLSKGLAAALERVKTPFVQQLDDDVLLTPRSDIHGQLAFLQRHPEVDLVSLQVTPDPSVGAREYSKIRMDKSLLIDAGTLIEEREVVYKGTNLFLARTESVRKVGYDPNIRMIIHYDFFWRAAGKLVCVQDPNACVLHCHNAFDREYRAFRNDTSGDSAYLNANRGPAGVSFRQLLLRVKPKADSFSYRAFMEAYSAAVTGRKLHEKCGAIDIGIMTKRDWLKVFLIAHQHHVLPMILDAMWDLLKTCGDETPEGSELDGEGNSDSSVFPVTWPQFRQILQQQSFMEITCQIEHTDEFLPIYSAFRNNGLRPLVVKGMICCQLYPQPDHRRSVDEDLLIEPDRWRDYHRVLLNNSYRLCDLDEEELEDADEITYVNSKGILTLELHKYLFPPESEAYGDLNHYFTDIRKDPGRMRPVWLNENMQDFLTPSPTNHFLYIICHAFKHFLYSGFGVRQVSDICLFAGHYSAEFDWERIQRTLKEMRGETFLISILKIGERWFDFTLKEIGAPPEWTEAEVDWKPMLKDLLVGGVWGTSSMSRLHSSSISLHAVAAEKRGAMSGFSAVEAFFPSARSLEKRYPSLKKAPWLLPVVWVVRGVRYYKELKDVSLNSDAAEAIRTGKERLELLRAYDILKGRRE